MNMIDCRHKQNGDIVSVEPGGGATGLESTKMMAVGAVTHDRKGHDYGS